MNKRTLFSHLRLSTLILLAPLCLCFYSCAKTNTLQGLTKGTIVGSPFTTNVNLNFCVDPPTTPAAQLKMIIIQDHSGSNSYNYFMQGGANPNGTPDTSTYGTVIFNPALATDPTGSTRYGGLLSYLAQNIDNSSTPTKFYSIIGFNQNALSYPTAGFTPDTTTFYNYVANQATAMASQGVQCPYTGTDYQASCANNTANAPGTTSANPLPYLVAPPTPYPSLSPAPQFYSDAGNTSYLSALYAAQQLIKNDIAAAEALPANQKTLSSYVIVFMSDGSPIVYDIVNSANPPIASFPPADANYFSGVYNISNFTEITANVGNLTYYFFKEPTSTILGAVTSIVDLATAHQTVVAGINLFSIYYYYNGTNSAFPSPNIDGNGQDLLAQMAAAGNGTFYNLTSGSQIDYTKFLPTAVMNSYKLSDLFVTNASLSWWNDGKAPHHTSHVNGLPDDVAAAWGIPDPTVRDTLGDGVSDSVKYKLYSSNYPSFQSTPPYIYNMVNHQGKNFYTNLAAGVTNLSSTYQGGCNSVGHSLDPNQNFLFSSTENNNWLSQCSSKSSVSQCLSLVQDRGLNDCEKILLGNGSGVSQPDSNNDLIPDTLEFKNGVPFQVGTASATSSALDHGYSLYNKIKYSLPTQFSLSQLLNIQPAVYSYTTYASGNQTCYKYNVSQFLNEGPTVPDKVRVDVVLQNQAYQNQFLFRSAIKSFPAAGATTLQINGWTDPGEIQQGTWSTWP